MLFSVPVLLAAGTLLGRLTAPLWYDEALTVLEYVILPSPGEIYRSYTIPNNHILYTQLLWVWVRTIGEWFPHIVLSLRLLSFVLSLAAVAWLMACCRRRTGPVPAWLAAAALACSLPLAVHGCGVRGYAFSLLCGVAALHGACLIRENRLCSGTALYAAAALTAVAILPTNLLYFAALAPLILLTPHRHWRRALPLAAMPLAGLLFYVPILPSFWRVIQSGHGWGNPWACAWQLFGGMGACFLPLLGVAGVGLCLSCRRPRKTRLPAGIRAAAWSSLLLPATVIFLLRPSPFPRLFLIFLPLWLFLLAFAARPVFAASRRTWGRQGLRLAALGAAALVLGWSVLIHAARPTVAALFRPGPLADDLLLPYYVTAEFDPESLAEWAGRQHARNPNTRLVVTVPGDPFSLFFAGRCRGLPDELWQFSTPNRRLQLPSDTSAVLVVAHDAAEVPAICARLGLAGDFRLVRDQGYQKVFGCGSGF